MEETKILILAVGPNFLKLVYHVYLSNKNEISLNKNISSLFFSYIIYETV